MTVDARSLHGLRAHRTAISAQSRCSSTSLPPFPADGSSDVVARFGTEKMGNILG